MGVVVYVVMSGGGDGAKFAGERHICSYVEFRTRERAIISYHYLAADNMYRNTTNLSAPNFFETSQRDRNRTPNIIFICSSGIGSALDSRGDDARDGWPGECPTIGK